jgi:hypothetical protein
LPLCSGRAAEARAMGNLEASNGRANTRRSDRSPNTVAGRAMVFPVFRSMWPYRRERATRRHKKDSESRLFPSLYSALALSSQNHLCTQAADPENAKKRPVPEQVGNCCHSLLKRRTLTGTYNVLLIREIEIMASYRTFPPAGPMSGHRERRRVTRLPGRPRGRHRRRRYRHAPR